MTPSLARAAPDRLSPSNFVSDTETLVWEGRPSAALPPTGTERALRLVGVLMVACFALFALLGWANREDLDGAGGVLISFLVLSGGAAALFLWGIPAIGRAGRAYTRYGVTDTRAMIVHGLGGVRFIRIRIAPGQDVTVVPVTDSLSTVVFGHHRMRAQVRPQGGRIRSSAPGNHVDFRRPLQFQGLTPEDAIAAQGALLRIRGRGTGPHIEQKRG